MSSNIPTRRVTRATRPAVVVDENARVRVTATTRSKPLASENASQPIKHKATSSRTALGTVATQQHEATLAGKRKRDALNEVTNNKAKLKAAQALKGGADTDAGPIKPSTGATTTTAPAVTRVALRTTVNATVSTTNATTIVKKTRNALATVQARPAAQQQEQPPMTVDLPTRATRRAPSRPAAVPVAPPAATSEAAPSGAIRRVQARKTVTTVGSRTATAARVRRQEVQVEDEDDLRAHKKRRTSSEAGDVVDPVEETIADLADHDVFRTEYLANLDPEEITGWEDLDADDEEDPLMVSEYVGDIFEYLIETEKKSMPKHNYITMQKELTWKMRGILVDWLVDIHSSFRQLPETLFLAVNLMDRFLSLRVVSLSKVQLVGVACLFVAAKYEEICAPSVKNMAAATDSAYTEAEILDAEKYVLRAIEWNLSYSSPITFLRRASKADGYDVRSRTIAKYLAEIACVEWRLLSHPPSLISAAAMWLARLMLDKPEWSPTLAHYAGYSEEKIISTAGIMVNYVLRSGVPEHEEHEKFFKKYAGRKFMKASLYVRAWACSRWPAGSVIRLQDELDSLKTLALENQAAASQ